jgi:hypothetical protein
MGSNRYTQLAPTEFNAPLFQPNWEGLDTALQTQQQMYDITKGLDEKVPKHLQAHAEDAMRYKQSVSAEIDKVAEAYRTQDLATANKTRNELLRKVGKDWMPGGEAYALEDAYNTVQSLVGKYDELYKDDPSYMNEVAQMDITSQIKKWDYDPKTGKYSKVSDPMYGEYINIQKEAHEFFKGMVPDGAEEVTQNGHAYWKVGEKLISKESVREAMQNFLSQERYKQQLTTEKYKKFGHKTVPQELLTSQTEQARQAALDNVDNTEADILTKVDNMSVEDKKALQEELKNSGYYTGIIDGDFGPKSREAMGKYFEAKREEARGTEITDDTYNQLVKEEYIKPMVEIHAFRQTTMDVKDSAFAVAQMRAAAKKSLMNGLLATIPTKPNTGVTLGVTVHQTYEDLSTKLHDAKLNLESSKNNIIGVYSSKEYQSAFGVPTTYMAPGPDGKPITMTSTTIKNEAMTVNADALESYTNAVKAANSIVGQGNANDPTYMKAVEDEYVKNMRSNAKALGINYTEAQLRQQANLLHDSNNRSMMNDAQVAYYNNKTAVDDIETHKKDMTSKYLATPEAKAEQDKWYKLYTDQAPKFRNQPLVVPTDAKFNGVDLTKNSTEELMKLKQQLDNPVTRKQWATRYGVTEDALMNASKGIPTTVAQIEKTVGSKIDTWAASTGYKYSQPSAVITGETAHDEFGKDVVAIVNDSDISRLITEEGLDNDVLPTIGYNRDGTKQAGHKLTSGTIAFRDIGGRKTMVMQVTADWDNKGGQTGQALIPMATISEPTKKAMYAKGMGMQFTLINNKPNAQGIIRSDDLAQQHSLIYGHGWFDDVMASDNPKLSTVYVESNPIKQGQSRSLGSFNNVSMGGVTGYVVEYKPKVSTGTEPTSDFFVLTKEQYNTYRDNNNVIPSNLINHFYSGGKSEGTSFDDLGTLKQQWGRRDLTKYTTQNPNYSAHKLNDANAGVMGAAGAMIGSDDAEVTEDTYFDTNPND